MRALLRLRCCGAGEDQQLDAVRIMQHGCNSRVACKFMLGHTGRLWVEMQRDSAAKR